ncbi:MAG: hypothetical protein ACTSR8_21910 [Promethearchaeota archaeon]
MAEQEIRKINIVCPDCRASHKLQVPIKIINQSKQLTTVSIPSGLVCEHSFQAFVDKNFKVRGYQKVDFEFTKMEYFEDFDDISDQVKVYDEEENKAIPIIKDVVNVIREFVNQKDILGGAIFTVEGKVLYSSLPVNTLTNTIREFEVRYKKNLTLVNKLFMVLMNDEKICSEFIEIKNGKFIIVLVFHSSVKLGMANFYLIDLMKEIKKIQ